MGKSYFEVLNWASSFLEELGKEGNSIYYVFLERKNWSKTDWLIHLRQEMPKSDKQQLLNDLDQLAQNYPPQYLIGKIDFFGESFLINEHTLIPRPETEELVDICLKENTSRSMNVADIGTGSGVIAISLKKNRPTWQVSAVDISEKALKIAEKNANQLQTPIQFFLGDGLTPLSNEDKLDILISNPPYISQSEWELMDESVRTFEPKQALFADNDGLAIYEQLAKEASMYLKPTGRIYLEIGFKQGIAVQELFQQAFPKKTIRLIKDMSNNDRIIAVT